MDAPEFFLQARTTEIDTWVRQCARREIGFDELCAKVAALGFKTTSLYEMVRAAELAMPVD